MNLKPMAPIDPDEVPSIILQFMARSTMKAMLKGDPGAFGRNEDKRSPDEIARDMYEKTQKEKRAYEKALRRDVIYVALGKGTDEWKMKCFRALRRNVREPWLPEPTYFDFMGVEPPQEEIGKKAGKEVVGGVKTPRTGEVKSPRTKGKKKNEKNETLHSENQQVEGETDQVEERDRPATARGSIGRRKVAAVAVASRATRMLAELVEQMKANENPVAPGSHEAELHAQILKLVEEQKAGGGEGNSAEITKQLMKLQRELRELRRRAPEEIWSDSAQELSNRNSVVNGPRSSLSLSGVGKAKQFLLRKQRSQKNGQIMLHAKESFDEGVVPDIKKWLESRHKKNCPALEFSCVEPNSEEKGEALTELPLERTLGQPAFVWRRPRSGISRYYARAGPARPSTP